MKLPNYQPFSLFSDCKSRSCRRGRERRREGEGNHGARDSRHEFWMCTPIFKQFEFSREGLSASTHGEGSRLLHRRRFYQRQTPSGSLIHLKIYTSVLHLLIDLIFN